MTADDDALAETVEAVLDETEAVYEEYDRGYMDADAALRRLRTALDDLAATAEESRGGR